MCSNYRPVTRLDRLLSFFGVERGAEQPPYAEEIFPHGLAPMIRLDPAGAKHGGPAVRLEDAIYRFVPDFASRMDWARKTYNARGEEVTEKRTYKSAWAQGHRCIIPAEAIFEPRYFGTPANPGRSQRWLIRQPGDVPMGIAGIYRAYVDPATGVVSYAMSMLTVNADEHPVMKLFHKPGEEKRMVVILDPKDYADWLSCSPDQARQYLKPWSGPLEIEPATIPRMTRRPLISLIAAVARNGAIGRHNELLFRLPEDMQHFKRNTQGCPVIMGRKTWDSLPARNRPLPGRTNIVVTRNASFRAEGGLVAHTLADALKLASAGNAAPRIFVIGGAQLYAEALPQADELVLTEVDRDFDGDVFFPAWDRAAFREVSRERHHAGEPNHFDFDWVTYRRHGVA